MRKDRTKTPSEKAIVAGAAEEMARPVMTTSAREELTFVELDIKRIEELRDSAEQMGKVAKEKWRDARELGERHP